MAYFPAFIKLDNQKILLVGGGYIAQEKLEKLLDFTKDITLISLDYTDSILGLIKKHKLTYETRAYRVGDIKDVAIVIVAVDDLGLQEQIFYESKNYKCLCNSVDSVKFCDFIFPSYLKQEELTVAVSTSGASPAFAKYFRMYLQELIPDGISGFLQEMRNLRASIPKGKERMKMLDEKAKEYISSWSKN
ncbi:MAG: bifunctional precorrin-2 dehydrogenase/sirohydrochlorin ferrochelatase [Campylobacterota bacterium]|nr:bifunctional precorrin-2 dehydrogenase/sirohydrochlorin ferrochelatase [Campylobacterota bacterium]